MGVTGKMLGSGVGLGELAVTCRDWEELEGSGKKREVMRSGGETSGGIGRRAWGKSGSYKATWEGLFYLEVKPSIMINRFLNFSL